MINAVPVAVAVNVTEQFAVPTGPATRAHVVELNEPAGPVSAKVTVPVGVVGPALVSVTVAVQDEACPTTTGLAHETAVVVLCFAPAATMTLWDTEPVPPVLSVTVRTTL